MSASLSRARFHGRRLVNERRYPAPDMQGALARHEGAFSCREVESWCDTMMVERFRRAARARFAALAEVPAVIRGYP